MAVASVAGVMAHQLVTASPRRSRVERDELRVARRAAAKITAVREAIIDASVARYDGDGQVQLLFSPGDYNITGRRELDPIAPDQPASDTPIGEVDRAIQGLLTEFGDDSIGGSIPAPIGPPIDRPTNGPILTPIATPPVDADLTGDQSGSTPIDPTDRPHRSTPDRPQDRGPDRGRARARNRAARKSAQTRSIEDLRADLARAIADPDIDVNPDSAESIRRTLQCSPERARTLRDERG
jgi:hypothetical protein